MKRSLVVFFFAAALAAAVAASSPSGRGANAPALQGFRVLVPAWDRGLAVALEKEGVHVDYYRGVPAAGASALVVVEQRLPAGVAAGLLRRGVVLLSYSPRDPLAALLGDVEPRFSPLAATPVVRVREGDEWWHKSSYFRVGLGGGGVLLVAPVSVGRGGRVAAHMVYYPGAGRGQLPVLVAALLREAHKPPRRGLLGPLDGLDGLHGWAYVGDLEVRGLVLRAPDGVVAGVAGYRIVFAYAARFSDVNDPDARLWAAILSQRVEATSAEYHLPVKLLGWRSKPEEMGVDLLDYADQSVYDMKPYFDTEGPRSFTATLTVGLPPQATLTVTASMDAGVVEEAHREWQYDPISRIPRAWWSWGSSASLGGPLRSGDSYGVAEIEAHEPLVVKTWVTGSLAYGGVERPSCMLTGCDAVLVDERSFYVTPYSASPGTPSPHGAG